MERVERVDRERCTVPTGAPEADGTLGWDRTTLVLVAVHCADVTGLGYTYAPAGSSNQLTPSSVRARPTRTACLADQRLDALLQLLSPPWRSAEETCERLLQRLRHPAGHDGRGCIRSTWAVRGRGRKESACRPIA
ncbi:hypothetical protein ACF07Y_27710 [Streptomyces sp. NPDC016566]|uniref:hypothetical protein n=1 Tax=Streptomyces sp. NPDC016566 TaxID=3364967 RepID=UPI003702A039